jgi:hypothetical protein
VAEHVYTVHCTWDAEAEVWVVAATISPALATGAATLDGAGGETEVVIPELLEANGLLPVDRPGAIPFTIICRTLRARPDRGLNGRRLHPRS